VVTPVIDRAQFSIVPAELADPGVLARIRHRVRLRQFGTAWLTLDGKPMTKGAPARLSDLELVMPVLDERGARIRVVTEDDDTRLAVWIDRDDAWSSVATPIQLADRDGHASPRAGVWLTLGAPVETTRRAANRHAIHVHDLKVQIDGWVPDKTITHVWVATREDHGRSDHRRHGMRFVTESAQTGTPAKIAPHTVILGAPRPGAPVIATIAAEELRVGIVASTGDYREIELVRPYARIHGFVASGALVPSPDSMSVSGSGSGSGIGMSHADMIEIPTGTCLFDAIDGEVIGVQLQTTIRYGRSRTDKPEWSLVYAGTPWSIAALYVRDTSVDPKQPSWESCTQPMQHS